MDRQWCKKHGKSLPPPKLPKVVLVSVTSFNHTLPHAAVTLPVLAKPFTALCRCTSTALVPIGAPACILTLSVTLFRIQRVIKEWFQLVDDDGSGTLEHHELLAALQVSPAPATFQAKQHSRHML